MKSRRSCKKTLVFTLVFENTTCRLHGFIHPKGCMAARENHIDILRPVNGACEPFFILEELALVKGISLECVEPEDKIEVVTPVGNIVLFSDVCLECIQGYVYLMRKKNGIYIGGIREC